MATQGRSFYYLQVSECIAVSCLPEPHNLYLQPPLSPESGGFLLLFEIAAMIQRPTQAKNNTSRQSLKSWTAKRRRKTARGHLQPVENSTSNACLRLKAAFYPRSLHDRRCLFLLRTCYPGNVL